MLNLSKYTMKTQAVIVASARVAKKYGHRSVEPEHLLAAMLNDKPVQLILNKVGVNYVDVARSLDAELLKMARASGDQHMSARFVKLTAAAEDLASRVKAKKVEVAHVLLAFYDVENSTATTLLVNAGATRDKVATALHAGVRTQGTTEKVTPANVPPAEKKEAKESVLAKFSSDLTAKARDGQIGPIIGRSDEIRRVIQVLSRFTKNNPILVGQPGVGRTSIVEALAKRIADGDVPNPLKSKRILRLDLAGFNAGTGFRGQLEERVQELLNEIKADGNVILFIDEIQRVVGPAGPEAAGPDLGSMLKPELARGEIQILGSTTPDAYRNSIEKDKNLERRFQEISVEEPTSDEALRILRGIKQRYENHHAVRIQDPALVAAVQLSVRYLPDRCLPDKAIDLIDEAASRLRIEIDSVPNGLDQKERNLTHLEMELHALSSDNDRDTLATRQDLEKAIVSAKAEATEMRARWQKEVELIKAIRVATEERADALKELEAAEKGGEVALASDIKFSAIKMMEERADVANKELLELRKAGRLVRDEVEAGDVAGVVGDLTGIPVATMTQDEKTKLLQMEEILKKRVVGQDEAIKLISDAVKRVRSGMSFGNKPVSMLLAGSSGSGKTELARALAEFMFDSETALFRLDFSEFSEKHTVARLIGAPPGYKDADIGGQFDIIRKNPNKIILIDEAEKGHPEIFNLFLQILDDGRLTDSMGRLIDFKNTIIIMTSNAGSHFLLDSVREHGCLTTEARKQARSIIDKSFRPEFLGRIDQVVFFNCLSKDNMGDIADINLRKVQKLVEAKHMKLEISQEAKTFLIDHGFDPAYGARPLKRAIQDYVQTPLATAVLSGGFKEGDTMVATLDGDKLDFVKKQADSDVV